MNEPTPRTLRQTIADHPIAAFLVILYPLSWILSLPALLGKSGLGVLSIDIPPQAGILGATLLGLTGVAFLVTRIADGKDGVRALWRHVHHVRTGVHWYLLAVFGLPLLMLTLAFLTGGPSALEPAIHHWSQFPTVYLLNLIVIAVLISVWEETGWMGFVTARLQRRWGPVWASIAVAPLFGFIHFPLLFVAGGVTDGKPQGIHILEDAFYLLVMFSVPVRLLITWAYNSSGGSLPVVGLLHASIDISAGTAMSNVFYPQITDLRLLYIALAVVVLVLAVVTRGRLGYRPTEEPLAAHAVPVVTVAS